MCGLCKNCKYWDTERIAVRATPPQGMGHCENPIIHEGYYYAKYAASDRAIYTSGAIIEDDEGWGWFVAPNFGCVHFEAD